MPPRQREPSIDRTTEYEEFMKRLAAYHEKRGTTLEPEPRVGPRRLDLLRLYKRVVADGGYDLVSDTKKTRLGWRRIAEDFIGKSPHLPAQAFTTKSAYYKNLAAYEISDHWKRDPPPKEILEDVSAKGGDLLTRTLENFDCPVGRETENLVNGDVSDAGDVEKEKTPKEEKMDIDDPGSTGRVTRGLRQAPPQRVLFQPDGAPSRQTRHASNHVNSPTPAAANVHSVMNGTHGPSGASLNLANYEPRQQYPLTLKPVTTPGNAPEFFRQKRQMLKETASGNVSKKYKGMMLPGSGFPGPNIYVRALLSLRSGIPEEEEYALHHLVKISHERGDKYQFEQFPGLADALIVKVLHVSSLFYNVHWEISYEEDVVTDSGSTLNGLTGTRNILQKLRSGVPLATNDDIHTQAFSAELGRITEAGLVIRNMVMLEENAAYISKIASIRDFITITLNLPRQSTIVELQHYALEIAEQVTKYFSLGPHDPLYLSLLSQLEGTDRGAIITSLRAIGRIAMTLEEHNRLEAVPFATLRRVCEWMLVEDEELRSACLDFLYQYTSTADNVGTLMKSVDVEGLVDQLVRLLLYNAKEDERKFKGEVKEEPVPPIPQLTRGIMDTYMRYDEPERSSLWLKSCFEYDEHSEMTQISLWQAYQAAFAPYGPFDMQASNFIKNVSSTFTGASAQVAAGNKYVISGIKPRDTPVDRSLKPFARCLWHISKAPLMPTPPQLHGNTTDDIDRTECSELTRPGQEMFEHILDKHLHVPKRRIDEAKEEKFHLDPDSTRTYDCRWGGCQHFANTRGIASAHTACAHIKTHLPDSSGKASHRQKYNRSEPAASKSDETSIWLNTCTDERNDAAGLPLTSALVLRNLARYLSKTDAEHSQEDGGLVNRIFGPVKEQLYYVMAHNFALRDYIAALTRAIAAAGG
ncbi:hypothetical protein B0A49_00382 [Cryomyces minteri]|uniref:ARID domain-containing protein n=1 Tax=Cryomyces minteri TaxID=331657 RepID=A0A4U0XSG1_9PEZI|nr:hypothetical protein B0A49_02562 [Cryomyces minteri]TKA81896.1 hypothetical protein B0A49_00382 [Cryomyces minteri]